MSSSDAGRKATGCNDWCGPGSHHAHPCADAPTDLMAALRASLPAGRETPGCPCDCSLCGHGFHATCPWGCAGREASADERCACGRALTDTGACSLCEYVPERCNCTSAGRKPTPAERAAQAKYRQSIILLVVVACFALAAFL